MSVIKNNGDCDAIIQKTIQLFKERKYDELIKCYQNIIEYKESRTPDEYAADLFKYYANISCIYHIQKKYQMSLDNAYESIKLNPAWYKSHYRAAKACEGLLDIDRTKLHFVKMLEIGGASEKEINSANVWEISLMRNWLLQNGANMIPLTIEYYDVDYRGVLVENPIPKNSDIISVPFKCIVSLEESKLNIYNMALKNTYTYDSDHTYVALELLHIKNTPGHFKYPYTLCLPKYFSNVPINFSEDELVSLNGSFSKLWIVNKKNNLLNEYKKIVAALEKQNIEFPFSAQEFIWARTVVITRTYGIKRNINGVEIADNLMVPFADMANHVLPANTHWYFNNETNSFVVTAATHLSIGDKLFESYGKKSNYRYFVNYGFTVEDNPHEEVYMLLDPKLFSIFYGNLYESNPELILNMLGSDCIFLVGYTMNEKVHNMIKYCRFVVSSLHGSIEAKDMEISAFNIISTVAAAELSKFETSVEDDVNMLKNMDFSFNERNCIIVRLGEKRLLNFYSMYFSKLIEMLQVPKTDRKKIFNFIKDKLCNKSVSAGFVDFAKSIYNM